MVQNIYPKKLTSVLKTTTTKTNRFNTGETKKFLFFQRIAKEKSYYMPITYLPASYKGLTQRFTNYIINKL